MTVGTEVVKIISGGNGATTSFPFSPIVIYDITEIEVVREDNLGNLVTLSQAGAGQDNYTVVPTGTFPSTGSITYPVSGTALPTGWNLIIKRILPLTQSTDLENQGGYFPQVQEDTYDKLTFMVQQLDEVVGRALTIPITDVPPLVAAPYTNPTMTVTAKGEITAIADGGAIVDALNDLSDVNITTPTTGQALVYNGSTWVNQVQIITSVFGRTGAVTAAEGDYNLTELGDVDVSSATNGQVLTRVAGVWTGTTFPGGGDMLGANNLSDVADAATSRTNIGAGTGSGDLLAANDLSDVADALASYNNIGEAWTQAADGKTVLSLGASGATAHGNADAFVLEVASSNGWSIIGPNSNLLSFMLGNPGKADAAAITWFYDTNEMTIGPRKSGGFITFITSNQTALTLDASQNALFAGAITTSKAIVGEYDAMYLQNSDNTAGSSVSLHFGATSTTVGVRNAKISAISDVGNGHDLVFYTNPNGGSEVEAFRLTNAQNATFAGGVTLASATPILSVGDANVSTGLALARIGFGRTGSGISEMSLITDTTFTTYGFQMARGAGANGLNALNGRGTAGIEINAVEAGPINFKTSNTARGGFTSSGDLAINETFVAKKGAPLFEYTVTVALLAANNGTWGTCVNAGAIILTVPLEATESIPVGAEYTFEMGAAGTVTFAPEGGVTLDSKDGNLEIGGKHGVVVLKKKKTNEWTLAGDLV